MSSEQTWRFENRWRIEAVVETRTPLRIGSGYTDVDATIHSEGNPVEVDAVALDAARRPCIPGSALKAALRVWAEARGVDEDLIGRVFGIDSRAGHSGRGGKFEVWDALLDHPASAVEPVWRPERGLTVETSVAIDRLTRTARDQKLFHRRVVVPLTRFRLVVTGSNLDDDEVALLVAALSGFDDAEQPITLGAETGSGKGHLELVPGSLVFQCIGAKDLLAWLDDHTADGSVPTWRILDEGEQAPILKAAAVVAGRAVGAGIVLGVQIGIDGPFLVNDPPPRPAREVRPEERSAAHRPRRDHDGRTLLPAKSVRGVLRSRAERIIRTLSDDTRRHACRVDDQRFACEAIRDPVEVARLCLACRVFGAPGWRAPLAVSDFTLIEERSAGLRQEFVAIDRFTGGGVERLKFSAQPAIDPHFSGRIELDLARSEPWMIGLLALVLRDLCEGDLNFGFGAAKGYGAAVGLIADWRLHGLERLPPTFADLDGLNSLPVSGTGLTDGVQTVIEAAVRVFRDMLGGERP